MQKLSLIVLIALLSSCAQVSSNALSCPTYFNYSAEKQNKAADELEACTECVQLDSLMIDYHIVRKQILNCRK